MENNLHYDTSHMQVLSSSLFLRKTWRDFLDYTQSDFPVYVVILGKLQTVDQMIRLMPSRFTACWFLAAKSRASKSRIEKTMLESPYTRCTFNFSLLSTRHHQMAQFSPVQQKVEFNNVSHGTREKIIHCMRVWWEVGSCSVAEGSATVKPFQVASNSSICLMNNQTPVSFTFVDLSSCVTSYPPISFWFNLSIPLFVSAVILLSFQHILSFPFISSAHIQVLYLHRYCRRIVTRTTVICRAECVKMSRTTLGHMDNGPPLAVTKAV